MEYEGVVADNGSVVVVVVTVAIRGKRATVKKFCIKFN
jgi:hypothetical protein